MGNIYKCINTSNHNNCIYNRVWIYDKITDELLLTCSTLPDENGVEHPVEMMTVIQQVNNPENNIINRVTNKDINNLGYIYICDSSTDTVDVKDYCIINGDLVRPHKIILECDAIDTDKDGIVDIEGDGTSIANFIIKIVDFHTESLINNFTGIVRIISSRGKVIGGTSGFINIINGQGSFQLKSIPETVAKVEIKALLTINGSKASMLAIPATMEISFR